MRGVVLFCSSIIAVLVFLSFLVVNLNEKNSVKNNPNNLQFSTFTSAVCENKDELLYCKDELFVNCNGNISKASEVNECNGIRFDDMKVTGFAVFRHFENK